MVVEQRPEPPEERGRFRRSVPKPPQPTLEAARKAGATLAYGNFITLLINFLIVAWVLFMVVKAMNRLKKPAPPAAPAAPPREQILLEEIRDLLAKRA